MTKRSWLILTMCAYLMLVAGFRPERASAEESRRILVLPFKVYSRDNVAYLRTQIPAAISSHLSSQGADCVSPDAETADLP